MAGQDPAEVGPRPDPGEPKPRTPESPSVHARAASQGFHRLGRLDPVASLSGQRRARHGVEPGLPRLAHLLRHHGAGDDGGRLLGAPPPPGGRGTPPPLPPGYHPGLERRAPFSLGEGLGPGGNDPPRRSGRPGRHHRHLPATGCRIHLSPGAGLLLPGSGHPPLRHHGFFLGAGDRPGGGRKESTP